MHVLHFVLVKTENPEPRETLATILGSESGYWWDWYEVGGRWDGVLLNDFPNLKLEDKNVLPLKDYPVEGLKIIQECHLIQERTFVDARAKILGTPVAVAGDNGHVFGIPIARTQDIADEETRENQLYADTWQKLLLAPSLEAVQKDPNVGMLSYYMGRAMDLVSGRWTFDSAFFDSAWGNADALRTLEELRAKSAEELDGYYLIAVDFHH